VLAVASGCAGALAFTTGVSAALIGVMVAAALLPPLLAFGLLSSGKDSSLAMGALVLFLVNPTCDRDARGFRRAMARADRNINKLLENLQGAFNRRRQKGIDEQRFDVISGSKLCWQAGSLAPDD